jgi:hypothetical protein
MGENNSSDLYFRPLRAMDLGAPLLLFLEGLEVAFILRLLMLGPIW